MVKDLIEFPEFQEAEKKLEVRMGTITEVERLNKKMLKLVVDLGEEEPRQVVTNIGSKVPEAEVRLVRLQFPFITNLKPAFISGLESTAMIMVVENVNGEIELPLQGLAFTPGAKLL